jgi:putative oxidoreductase
MELDPAVVIAFLCRLALIALFMPFSALDKVLDFSGAVGQAREIGVGRTLGAALILAGLFVEVIMSLGVLTGIADRFAALVLAGYCAATAVLYKRFWATGDFALRGPSKGRDLFWDFWKNIAVAGGFLLVAFGTTAQSVDAFFEAPFSSSEPYLRSEAAPSQSQGGRP